MCVAHERIASDGAATAFLADAMQCHACARVDAVGGGGWGEWSGEALCPACERLEGEHPAVDYTPPHLITLIVTDLGVLTPSAVSDQLIKLYL